MLPSRIVNATNWRRAIGELVLIVAGITIAFGVDTWREDQKARQVEAAILSQFLVTLKEDIVGLQDDYEITRDRLQILTELRSHIEQKRPYSEGLPERILNMRRWQTSRINSAPFDDLNSRGLHLISNASLRLKLIEFYERERPWLEDRNAIDRQSIILFVEPYLLEEFRHTSTGFAPNDYNRLLSDSRFISILSYRINKYNNRTLPAYQRVVSLIEELIKEVEVNLTK